MAAQIAESKRPGPVSKTLVALSIEDDPATQEMLAAAFEDTDFNLAQVSTVADGIKYVREENPAIVLLDLSLPGGNGIDFITEVRGWSKVPIIVLSGTHEEDVKLQALYAGAEDYITKPFGIGELMARLKVALRHARQVNPAPRVDSYGILKLDHERRQVFVRGQLVTMTPLEFSLLSVLMEHPGEVVSHRHLLTKVWGEEFLAEAQYLRVYVGYLRRKIEVNPAQPKVLITEAGRGYRLSDAS